MNNDDDLSRAGWEAHGSAQRAAWLGATPLQRLRWLEEAIAAAFRTGALPRPTADPRPADDPPRIR